MKKTQKNNTMCLSVTALVFLFSGTSKAQIDHGFVKAKNDFVQAVNAADWDNARSAFVFIQDDLGKALPSLSSLLHNKLKDALAANDFNSANALVEWVAKLPEDVSMDSLKSALSNKIVDALKADDFSVTEMVAKVTEKLPKGINLNAVMSTWSNKVVDALQGGQHEQAQKLAKAVSGLLEGVNVNAVSSVLRNKIEDALQNEDHDKATMLASVASYLPKDTNMMSVLSLLANRMHNAINQDNVEQAIKEAKQEVAIAALLPEQARQHFFEKSLLPELARQIGTAYQNNNFEMAQQWGDWLSEVKEHATSEDGKKTVAGAEKFLTWAQKKMKNQ